MSVCSVGPDSDRDQIPVGTGTHIPFRPLDRYAPVRIYRRHLPHWRQDGATYFVTFRLADSIPHAVLARWNEERRIWLDAHGLTDGLSDETWQRQWLGVSKAERRNFEQDEARKLFVELDKCHGACHLGSPELAELVATALQYHHGQRLYCGDFVVMPNHVHWLLQPMVGHALEDILQSVKRFAATRINRLKEMSGPLWQKENYDRLVRDGVELRRICRYITANPAKAGIEVPAIAPYQGEWAMDVGPDSDRDQVPVGTGTHIGER